MAAGAAGLVIPASVMQFDIWVMLAVALACLPVFMTGREIARWEGGVFLFYYVAYVGYLVLLAQQHPALSGFAFLMTSFALPLTVIAMVVAMVRGTSKV
jgi:cation:H+ antiporter